MYTEIENELASQMIKNFIKKITIMHEDEINTLQIWDDPTLFKNGKYGIYGWFKSRPKELTASAEVDLQANNINEIKAIANAIDLDRICRLISYALESWKIDTKNI